MSDDEMQASAHSLGQDAPAAPKRKKETPDERKQRLESERDRLIAAVDTRAPPDGGYECEVSCVDWYGNARPIFIDERIFALTGMELIEGALASGRLAEIGRMQMTARPTYPRHAATSSLQGR